MGGSEVRACAQKFVATPLINLCSYAYVMKQADPQTYKLPINTSMYSKAECGQLVVLIDVPGKIGSLYSRITLIVIVDESILRNHTISLGLNAMN